MYNDDIWYATNIEEYDYVTAWNRLVYSADGQRVYNPSATDVWIKTEGKSGTEIVSVPAGKTISI